MSGNEDSRKALGNYFTLNKSEGRWGLLSAHTSTHVWSQKTTRTTIYFSLKTVFPFVHGEVRDEDQAERFTSRNSRAGELALLVGEHREDRHCPCIG